MTPPTRVLVTGAGGAIGAAVSRSLAASGVAVVGLAHREIPPADRAPFADVVHADARDEAAVRGAMAGVDAVVHTAALAHPSLGTPAEVFGVNAAATFTVLSVAGELGVPRAITCSSINASGVIMNPADVLPAYFPLDEDQPSAVADAYSHSKRVDELSAEVAHAMFGLDVLALRLPLTKDADELRRAAARAQADPAGSVREGWSYLDQRDAVALVRAGLEREWSGVHVVLATAADTLLTEPTEAALARFAPGVPLRSPLPRRQTAVSNARVRRLLGFEAKHSWTDAEPRSEENPA